MEFWGTKGMRGSFAFGITRYKRWSSLSCVYIRILVCLETESAWRKKPSEALEFTRTRGRERERERGRLWSVATNWLFLWLRFSIDPLRCLDLYLSEYQNKSSGLAWQSCDQ